MNSILIDGVPANAVPADDRGLQYGDGLFETLRAGEGRVRWAALHWQRLRDGCERLGLPFGQFAELEAECAQLAAGTDRCLLKVLVTRGSGRRGYRPQASATCRRIVSRHDWPAVPPSTHFRVGLSQVTLGVNPLLAGLKHLNRLEQVLAQQRADEWNEVLMMSSEGQLISGSMSNIFLHDGAGWFTPSLERSGVAGVMRSLVLDAAAAAGVAITVAALSAGDVERAQAAFVTNVRWGLQSVTQLRMRALPQHEDVERLWRVIDARDC